jgi:hypothetical protein
LHEDHATLASDDVGNRDYHHAGNRKGIPIVFPYARLKGLFKRHAPALCNRGSGVSKAQLLSALVK